MIEQASRAVLLVFWCKVSHLGRRDTTGQGALFASVRVRMEDGWSCLGTPTPSLPTLPMRLSWENLAKGVGAGGGRGGHGTRWNNFACQFFFSPV